MGDIIHFDDARATRFLRQALDSFIGDPPDSDFQRGYLSALLNLYRQGLGRGATDARLMMLEEMTRGRADG